MNEDISIMTLLSIIMDAKEALELIKGEGLELSEEAAVAQDSVLATIKQEILGDRK